MLYELSLNDFENLVIKKSGFVLVDFFAPWCRGCSSLELVLENISEDYFKKLSVYKLNCDKHTKLVDDLEISSLPTMILYHDGKEVKRLSGLSSEKTIKEWLDL